MSNQSRLVELPEDLQGNIFLRLPVKCVLICKCVCKSFCTIIQNPNFVNAHLTCPRPITTETSRSLILGFFDIPGLPFIKDLHNLLSIDDAGSVISSSPLIPPIPYVGTLHLVGSCNGLICFDVLSGSLTSEGNFLLWNPVTRQTRYLPRLENRNEYKFMDGLSQYNCWKIKAVDHERESYFNQWKLAVVNEDLAMIYWKFPGEFQVWVMTKYGVEGSWVLKFDFGCFSTMYPLGYWKYDLMIIVLEQRNCLLDLNGGEAYRILDMENWTIKRFFCFEESLAPVRRLL